MYLPKNMNMLNVELMKEWTFIFYTKKKKLNKRRAYKIKHLIAIARIGHQTIVKPKDA